MRRTRRASAAAAASAGRRRQRDDWRPRCEPPRPESRRHCCCRCELLRRPWRAEECWNAKCRKCKTAPELNSGIIEQQGFVPNKIRSRTFLWVQSPKHISAHWRGPLEITVYFCSLNFLMPGILTAQAGATMERYVPPSPMTAAALWRRTQYGDGWDALPS